MNEDIIDLVYRTVAVHRWIDQHMIEEEALRGIFLIPVTRTVVERRIELRIGSHAGHESSFVVRRASHKPISEARPGNQGFAGLKKFLGASAGLEEFVCAMAERVDRCEHIFVFRIVQRVIEPGNRAARVTKRGVRGYVSDTLAIDVHLATVPETGKVLRAIEQQAFSGHHRLHDGALCASREPVCWLSSLM